MSYANIVETMQSGYIELSIPLASGSFTNVKGLLQDEVSIKFSNNWQSFAEFDSSYKELQELQNVFSTSSILQWIPGSSQTWRGNKPIDVTASFYIVNYNSKTNAAKQVKDLSALATASVSSGQNATVTPHGGYKYDYMETNSGLTNRVLGGTRPAGTVTMRLNNKTVINGLLLKDVTVKPSAVIVKNGQPLYYDVSTSFMLYRAPIEADLKTMFGG